MILELGNEGSAFGAAHLGFGHVVDSFAKASRSLNGVTVAPSEGIAADAEGTVVEEVLAFGREAGGFKIKGEEFHDNLTGLVFGMCRALARVLWELAELGFTRLWAADGLGFLVWGNAFAHAAGVDLGEFGPKEEDLG